jgi:hypothetical protein
MLGEMRYQNGVQCRWFAAEQFPTLYRSSPVAKHALCLTGVKPKKHLAHRRPVQTVYFRATGVQPIFGNDAICGQSSSIAADKAYKYTTANLLASSVVLCA